jgi:hypothetical protein
VHEERGAPRPLQGAHDRRISREVVQQDLGCGLAGFGRRHALVVACFQHRRRDALRNVPELAKSSKLKGSPVERMLKDSANQTLQKLKAGAVTGGWCWKANKRTVDRDS